MQKELELKEIQKISTDILKVVADLCEKLNLRYYLMYGTLIGAVRHQGYIPWDDDLDIMMPREDYDALLKYWKEHGQQFKHLQVFTPDEVPEYPYMITRISDRRYRMIMDNEKEYGMGIFIDIYPFDGLGNTKKEALKYALKGDRLSSLCYQATRKRCAVETTTSNFRKMIKPAVFAFSKFCGKDIFQKKLKKLERNKPYDTSEYVGCVVWLTGGERDIFLREWFEEYEMVPFEDSFFRIPKAYDAVLRHAYGNYMELPPQKERVGHHNYKVVRREKTE